MGKVLFGIIAICASLMLVDSLTCNSCTFSLAGFCLLGQTATCTGNSSVCYTSTATFPSLTSFKGFTSSGCLASSSTCGTNTAATLLGVSYNTSVSCCSTSNCNSVSAAPSAKMTLSATIGAAALALVWGSMM